MSEKLKGHVLAENIRKKVKARLDKLDETLGLGVILAGDNPASELYVSLKEAAAREVGIYVEVKKFEADAKQEDMLAAIEDFNEREDIQGILVQLPLPEKVNEDDLIAAIDPQKDVDGFLEANLVALEEEKPSLAPPVALAVMRLIQATRQPLGGKEAIVVSNHPIFARPLRALMKEAGASGTYVSPGAANLEAKLRNADIVIVATGNPHSITESMVSEGSILIDVGTTRVENGKVLGDIAPAAKNKAAFASTVPGGVGPLTVAYLLLNVLKAHQLTKQGKKDTNNKDARK
jgi:methylenetetrahydrofolate dehydrogenase (NADP+)/methenyltetrahydrofolate cyclohydrolase